MTTIRQILREKGPSVLTVGPDNTVLDAIEKMAETNTGSVVVVELAKLSAFLPSGFMRARYISRAGPRQKPELATS